ncbi:MAG: hypothetical protein WC794_00035 [Candidatus Doudnabacteria bacterium]|jgi:hypothetical protein
MKWKFIENKGIISEDNSRLEIYFGMARQDLRLKLNFDPNQNKGRFDNEDSYGNALGRNGNWFRFAFSKHEDKLEGIEILAGTIDVCGVSVIANGGNLKETIKELEKKGFVFTKGDYSYTDFDHLVDIGDSEESGGDENQVCWFLTVVNFDYLKVKN